MSFGSDLMRIKSAILCLSRKYFNAFEIALPGKEAKFLKLVISEKWLCNYDFQCACEGNRLMCYLQLLFKKPCSNFLKGISTKYYLLSIFKAFLLRLT